jgi:hypothetical protein
LAVKNILIPKIENSWKMKMCLEDRDILAGDVYVDAIGSSIEQSRNILFIITDSFCVPIHFTFVFAPID